MKKQFKELKTYLKKRDYKWKFKLIVCMPIFVIMLLIDFTTKFIAYKRLSLDGDTIKLIHNFLSFHRVNNSGIAFGYNSNNPHALPGIITLAVFIAIAILALLLFINNKKMAVVFAIMLAGAIGNILDRTWNHGSVVDFIQMGPFDNPWYICNLADIFIILGAISLFFVILIEMIQTHINEKKLEKLEDEEEQKIAKRENDKK